MTNYIHPHRTQHTMPMPGIRQQGIKDTKTTPFKDVLTEQLDLKVSKHAKQRMNERDINISEKQWQVVTEKMSEAKQKGVTDALVLTNDAALVVSNKNNTIVTAMNREEASSKLFTNINGAIILHD